jgi:hypothetical protein
MLPHTVLARFRAMKVSVVASITGQLASLIPTFLAMVLAINWPAKSPASLLACSTLICLLTLGG